MKRYTFCVFISGDGDTPEEGWNNAVEAFSQEPGPTPDQYEEEDNE